MANPSDSWNYSRVSTRADRSFRESGFLIVKTGQSEFGGCFPASISGFRVSGPPQVQKAKTDVRDERTQSIPQRQKVNIAVKTPTVEAIKTHPSYCAIRRRSHLQSLRSDHRFRKHIAANSNTDGRALPSFVRISPGVANVIFRQIHIS